MPTNTTFPTLHAISDRTQTVSLSQAGAFEAMAACERDGIAFTAEIHNLEDAEALTASRYGRRVSRVVIEPEFRSAGRARVEVLAIEATLRAAHVDVPWVEDGAEVLPVALAA